MGKGRIPSKEAYESKGKKNVSGTELWKEMLLNNEMFGLYSIKISYIHVYHTILTQLAAA